MSYPHDPESADWLVGYRVRSRGYQRADPTQRPLQMRCPQHVTRWSLESVGIPVRQETLIRVAQAKRRDAERLKHNPNHGMDSPYFLPP